MPISISVNVLNMITGGNRSGFDEGAFFDGLPAHLPHIGIRKLPRGLCSLDIQKYADCD